MTTDVVAEFQRPIYETLVNFADALLDRVAATKNVSVEDVRRDLVDPLRRRIHDSPPLPTAAAPPPLPTVVADSPMDDDLEAELRAELAKYGDENTPPASAAVSPVKSAAATPAAVAVAVAVAAAAAAAELLLSPVKPHTTKRMRC